jgi:hypothetical protein
MGFINYLFDMLISFCCQIFSTTYRTNICINFSIAISLFSVSVINLVLLRSILPSYSGHFFNLGILLPPLCEINPFSWIWFINGYYWSNVIILFASSSLFSTEVIMVSNLTVFMSKFASSAVSFSSMTMISRIFP